MLRSHIHLNVAEIGEHTIENFHLVYEGLTEKCMAIVTYFRRSST
jgi:hypothetical protein